MLVTYLNTAKINLQRKKIMSHLWIKKIFTNKLFIYLLIYLFIYCAGDFYYELEDFPNACLVIKRFYLLNIRVAAFDWYSFSVTRGYYFKDGIVHWNIVFFFKSNVLR